MKKCFHVILIFSILVSFLMPIERAGAAGCTYEVKVVASNSTKNKDLGCTNDYNAAKKMMNEYASTETEVAVIYKGSRIVNARYALVAFTPGRVDNLYQNATDSAAYTYTHTSYGIDAAFIDYDTNKDMYKIKLSGFTGWISASSGTIVPTSLLNKDTIRVTDPEGLNVRDSANTSGNRIGGLSQGAIRNYVEKKTGEGYTWYKIEYANNADGSIQYGWIADNGSWLVAEKASTLQTYYQRSTTNNNLLHYFKYYSGGSYRIDYNTLGPAPTYLKAGSIYYSFDGNWFYTSLTSMLDDYRNSDVVRSINSDRPHYAYYLYLPNHTKTGYTAADFDQIIKNKGYVSNKDPKTVYIQCARGNDGNCLFDSAGNAQIYFDQNGDSFWNNNVKRTGISLLYGMGSIFIQSQEVYGVNALMSFGAALNESGTGTSFIAFAKNNLFGHGASDTNPVQNATSYATIADSIMSHARMTGEGYNSPTDWRYFGSHYGNKGSGMNVKYASDPYWGESQAANSYFNDRNLTDSSASHGKDWESNTTGIKMGAAAIPIRKQPRDNGNVIYTIKNNSFSIMNVPVNVFDKVYTTENGVTKAWYKVYTDVALDSNQNMTTGAYNFNYSYGYISAEYLYVKNNQPVIQASDQSIKYGTTFNFLKGVTASDSENGNLTSDITYKGTVDTTKPGVYPVTYEVIDNSNFHVSKTVNITVLPSDKPFLNAPDVEVSQYTVFDYMVGVTANDYHDGDLTSKVTYTGTVNTSILGETSIKYQVTNLAGETTAVTRKVTVVDNHDPVITASNKTVVQGTIFNYKNGVTAFDQESGDLTALLTYTGAVDYNKPGAYEVTYSVVDPLTKRSISKKITVTVETKTYIDKTGDFYFENMSWNSTSNRLEVSGYLAIIGMNNTKNDPISYDFILKNNQDDTEIVIPIERWLDGHPPRSYSDGVYNYSDTWFKGSIDLSNIPEVVNGEYTLYVRARGNNFQTKKLFRNMFGKASVRKIAAQNGTGMMFRNNGYDRDYPIELFVRKQGLIGGGIPPHSSNMFTSYQSLSFSGNNLNIVGSSYNVGLNYSSNSNVSRTLVFENTATYERFSYQVDSFVGNEIPLKDSDGLSKVRGWFDSKSKVDITKLPVGRYVIYVRTITGGIDDYGELNDIFLKPLNAKTIIGNKEYQVVLNKDSRFRLELDVRNK